jgi:3-methyl-2-oxobutanoate hydroxymethyltransferase
MARVTTATILDKKRKNEKITMLTSYDYSMAAMVDAAGIDMILVGDSLGNVILGYENTLAVTVDDMVHHTRAVCRAAKNALVVADMPFLSYHISIEEAVRNAGRLIQEGGAQAIKLEGGEERLPVIKAILDAEIPIVGHIGLTPQSVNQFGGFKVQGKDLETARKLIRDAKLLEEAGVFAITLEGVPGALAQKITESLTIPTIGIGAGNYCDGQVLVVNDALGMTMGHVAKFVKKFANLQPMIQEALLEYKKEVEEGTFPASEHTYTIKDEVLEKLY